MRKAANARASQPRYEVSLHIEGEIKRIVRAGNEQEAISQVIKQALGTDEQTPKKDYLNSFCWEVGRTDAHKHWRDMSVEEQEEWLGVSEVETKEQTIEEA